MGARVVVVAGGIGVGTGDGIGDGVGDGTGDGLGAPEADVVVVEAVVGIMVVVVGAAVVATVGFSAMHLPTTS